MFYNTIINESNTSLLNDVPDIEFQHEASYEGMLMTILETEKNYAMMMEAVAIDELNYFQEHGTEMIYEAANVKGFFKKIKDFFMNIWAKIQAFFVKYFRYVDIVVKSDKDFVAKYRPMLKEKKSTGFEYSGYSFTIEESESASALFNKGMEEVSELKKVEDLIGKAEKADSFEVDNTISDNLTKIAEKEETIMNTIRGKFVIPNSCDSSDFAQELYKKFRNGEDKPSTLKNIDINKQLEFIADAKKNKKAAEDDMKDLKETINKIIKKADNMEKALGSLTGKGNEAVPLSKRMTACNAVATWNRKVLTMAQLYTSARVSALKQRNRQAKAICVRFSSFKVEKDSASVTENALDAVKFI